MNVDLIKKFWIQLLSDLETDILAEVLSATIIGEQLLRDEKEIVFLPTFKNNRKYENDIIEINLENDEKNNFKCLEIVTSRYGIVNGLPDSFFIQYSEVKSNDDKYDFEQAEVFKKALDAAYAFFKPIEKYYSRVRINRELKEYELVKNNRYLICDFFGNQNPETEEEERFLKTMHLLPFIVGNELLTKRLIYYVMAKPVSIETTINEISFLNEAHQAKIEDSSYPLTLGVNSLLDNCAYTYAKVVKIRIEEIPNEEFYFYAPDHNFHFKKKQTLRNILDEIKKYYFPIDVDVDFDLYINNETNNFKLDTSYKKGEGILGYSTKI